MGKIKLEVIAMYACCCNCVKVADCPDVCDGVGHCDPEMIELGCEVPEGEECFMSPEQLRHEQDRILFIFGAITGFGFTFGGLLLMKLLF